MNKLVLNNIARFILLLLLQVLVLSSLNLGSYVNIYIYVAFIIMLPSNINNLLLLLLSFLMGISVDIFVGELGFHAFAATFTGFARIFLMRSMMSNAELNTGFTPSIKKLQPRPFLLYAYFMILIHNVVFFFMEAYTMHEFWQTILRIILSSLSTFLLIVAYQYIFVKDEK